MLIVLNSSSDLFVREVKCDCKIDVKKVEASHKLNRYEVFMLANNKKAISKCANATIFTDAYVKNISLVC